MLKCGFRVIHLHEIPCYRGFIFLVTNINHESPLFEPLIFRLSTSKMRVQHLLLSTTALSLLAVAFVHGHIDFDGYEIYTRASTRTVINSFKVFPANISWNAAKMKCEAEEAHLVIPGSTEEMNVLGLLFKKLPPKSPRHFHIGLTDQAKKGVWLSVLGKTLLFWFYFGVQGG